MENVGTHNHPLQENFMTRNGKIARLPNNIREQLNVRLENNEEGQPLLDWLNSLPETREVLDEQFNGVPVSKQNLSEWRQGGYREWVVRSDLCWKVSQLSEGADEIEIEVEAPMLAGKLATVLAAQYAKVLTDWDGEPDAKIEAKLHILRIFCRDIALLQRTMHRATNQKDEYFQKMDDEMKTEIKEMKDQAMAPIKAILKENAYCSMAGKNEGLRRMAALMAAIEYDQPLPKFDDMPGRGQTKSHPVKPSQTNEAGVKPAKPAKPTGGSSSAASDAAPPSADSGKNNNTSPQPAAEAGPSEVC